MAHITKYKISVILNVLFIIFAVIFLIHKRDKIIDKLNKLTLKSPTEQVLSSFNDKPLMAVNDSIMTPNASDTISILFLGNSISLHGIVDDMLPCEEERGMMATSTEKDYVHQIVMSLSNLNHLCVRYSVANIAGFERGFTKQPFNIESLEGIMNAKPDILVVQIGENVANEDIKDSELFEDRYVELLGNFHSCKRIITLPFWPDKQKQYAITNVAIKSKSYLVDISHLGDGTDRQNFASSFKRYKMPGVGSHPGDIGMKHIADCLYATINAILDEQ